MTAILLVVSTWAATWLWISLRSRGRAAAQAEAWRLKRDELLAEMASLRDDLARARLHATQVTRVSAGWSDGYKQGCDDMIRAMTALHGGAIMGQETAGESSDPG
jgi:hypothetical protein